MKTIFKIFDWLVISAAACLYGIVYFLPGAWVLIPAIAALFVIVNVIPSPTNFRIKRFRLRVLADGSDLLFAFAVSAIITVCFHLAAAFFIIKDNKAAFFISGGFAAAVLAVVFWNGIIRVYLTSVQLGIKRRVIGILVGWIPFLHIFALHQIVSVCYEEVRFENEKAIINEKRKDEKVCDTKYPLLLVHGVFFRDFKHVNYWGRIPKELESNGAKIFYGEHQSALSVTESGREIAERVKHIVEETGCEKVNVIAHSKGGLDCRSAISSFGAGEYIASLTTINTPHRGCVFADYLLNKAPEALKNGVAKTYNAALKKLGDENPDFLSAVYDLTASRCEILDNELKDDPRVLGQSVGSKLNRATSGKFPLNFTYHLAKYFDGPNDGLVAESSFKWGENYVFLTTDGPRGISHGDMVDMNRENINGFDVREFYVNLVKELKVKGL
ncbi:MAG: triacylglycerol lipase [Clostridia bacterium]|nr:triacylglycerol lipase [Clostridia bacterium]